VNAAAKQFAAMLHDQGTPVALIAQNMGVTKTVVYRAIREAEPGDGHRVACPVHGQLVLRENNRIVGLCWDCKREAAQAIRKIEKGAA